MTGRRRPARALALTLALAMLLIAPALAPRPATAGAGTPVPERAAEPLLAVTLPAEAVPPGALAVLVWHLTIPPGARETWAPDPTGPGVEVNALLEGVYDLRVEGPLQVVRAGGAMEATAPGAEVSLAAGDAWINPDVAAGATFHNPGNSPTVIVGAGLWDQDSNPDRVTYEPPGGSEGNAVSLSPEGWAQAGPLTVTIRRVTLAPGERLPPSDEALPIPRFVEAGRLTREIARAGTPATPSPPLVFRSGEWAPWATLGADRLAIVGNAEDEPLVFLELSIAPAGSAPGTPAR